jgi:diguanylate cyclase (GGDEF)-like protein
MLARQHSPIHLGSAPPVGRVLLVEDNPGDVVLVREMLREFRGPEMVSCSTLGEALDLLDGQQFDCILLDLSLPDTSGLHGVRHLGTAAPERPIIVLSGLSDEEVAVQAVQDGVQDYLVKGEVTGALLVRAIRYAVQRKRAELELARLALQDPLTRLPNRSLFSDRLEHALVRLMRADGKVGVLFIDLDGFKTINDRYGHAAGDLVLVQVADRLRDGLRGMDTLARLGGDEFTVLCEAIEDADEAVAIAGRLTGALAEPFLVEGSEELVSASVGIAIARALEDGGSVLRRADAAMYRAKGRGPGGCELDPE